MIVERSLWDGGLSNDDKSLGAVPMPSKGMQIEVFYAYAFGLKTIFVVMTLVAGLVTYWAQHQEYEQRLDKANRFRQLFIAADIHRFYYDSIPCHVCGSHYFMSSPFSGCCPLIDYAKQSEQTLFDFSTRNRDATIWPTKEATTHANN